MARRPPNCGRLLPTSTILPAIRASAAPESTAAAETLRAFERAVESCPEVMEMYEMTGAHDYLLRVVAARSVPRH